MADLGLTRGLFAIDSTVCTTWGTCRSWREPTPSRKELWHDVSNSLVIPHKDLGPELATVGGTILCTSATADTFKGIVLGTAAKKVTWHNGTHEVMLKCYAGRITGDSIVRMPASGTVYREIAFEFTSYDTRLYDKTDESTVIWGA